MKEVAENRTDVRPQMGAGDEQYTGLARHPMARKWLKRCLAEEIRKGAEAGPGEERDRHRRIAAEIREKLKPEVEG